MSQYLKALEILRNSGDQNGVALNYSGLGTLFTLQGKYGAALSALQESLKSFKQTNDQTWLMVATTGEYGNALSAVGRWEEGRKSLESAVKLATKVRNNNVLAQVLIYLGDNYFYLGDYAIARQHYQEAFQVATNSKSRQLLAIARFNLAKLDVVESHSASAIPVLKKQLEEFDSLGLKAWSVRSSIFLAEALLATGKAAEVQQELDRAIKRAEKLGLLVEQARAHYLMGKALDKAGRTNQATLSTAKRRGSWSPSVKKMVPPIFWNDRTSRTSTSLSSPPRSVTGQHSSVRSCRSGFAPGPPTNSASRPQAEPIQFSDFRFARHQLRRRPNSSYGPCDG